MSLEKLEKKVEEKASKVKSIDTDKILEEIQRVYRLCSKTNTREEKRLQYIEDKVNIVLDLLKYKEVDTDELKRKQEIEELEQRLKELRGE